MKIWALRRLFACFSAFAACAAISAPALALDLPKLDDKPVRLDVTETGILNWHFDNRNGLTDDDHYGEWINRLDTKLTWKRLTFGFRLDSVAYYYAPSPGYLAKQDVGDPASGPFATSFARYQASLANRYAESIYPSKIYLTYRTPNFEATAGDFYVQFGRGMVLSLRKIDEVAVDTTMRGTKLEYSGGKPSFRYKGVVVAGYANPVRVDESSGRRLTAPGAWYFLGMPRPVTDSSNSLERVEDFRPDGIFGAQIEGGPKGVIVGLQTSLVARGGLGQIVRASDPPTADQFPGSSLGLSNNFMETASVSLSLPDLPKQGAFYLEAAGQRFDRGAKPLGAPIGGDTVNGHAIYSSFSIGGDPVNVLVELRHTRRFWPLLANSNQGEFKILAYSAPPTTEPITTDTEFGFFGTCTSGGRTRVDVRLSKSLVSYVSVGRYVTWSERLGDCGATTDSALALADRNDVWDPFIGLRTDYDQKRSHVNAWTGIRFDEAAAPFITADGRESRIFYRESYLRYDWLHTLSPTWALQNQGFHRMRAEYESDARPWNEGEHYLAAQWSSKIIASVGYEYTDRGGDLLHYFNASTLWRITPSTSIRGFVGQQRGALRCVSGVCRVFPPFEGAKLEVVARF